MNNGSIFIGFYHNRWTPYPVDGSNELRGDAVFVRLYRSQIVAIDVATDWGVAIHHHDEFPGTEESNPQYDAVERVYRDAS